MLLSEPEGLGTLENLFPVTTVTSLLSSHLPQENKESSPATKVCWWSVDKVTSQNTPVIKSKRRNSEDSINTQ